MAVRVPSITTCSTLRRPARSPVYFGPFEIPYEQVFYQGNLSRAIVNLKPIVPGHVLIIPNRVISRFHLMSKDEVTDLYSAVHEIGPALEKHYGGEALTISVQDGKAAGQSVEHVHVHVLPRRRGDFARNDEIYDHLSKHNASRTLNLDEDRRPRSMEEMAAEARELRTLFRNQGLNETT